MGCDIHGIVEVARYEFDSEYFVPCIDIESIIDRSYAMFSQLFGVRMNDTDTFIPLAQERGLPKNIHQDTKEKMKDSDYHSHSWVSYEELVKFRGENPLGEDWLFLLKMMELLAKRYGKENIRLIVAFDN